MKCLDTFLPCAKIKKKDEQKTGSHWKTCGPPEEKFKFQLKRERNIQS